LTDLFNTICDTIGVYVYLINHFGDLDYMSLCSWAIVTDPTLTGIIAMTVQFFFAWRIYALTKSLIMTSIVVALAITGAVSAIITTHRAVITPEFAKFQEFNGTVSIWLGSAAAADIVITCTLVWYLRSHRTGFKGSDMIVDRIIRITMQTGLLTSITAIINIVLFVSDPTGTHFLVNLPLCKLYSNSLFSTLNARGSWKFSESSSSQHSAGAAYRLGSLNPTYLDPQAPGVIVNGSQQQIKVDPSTPMHTDVRGKQEVHVHVESYERSDVTV